MNRKEVSRMRINGTNQTNWNPYQKQAQQQKQVQAQPNQDRLEISDAAKSMQEAGKLPEARKERLEELKLQVENGTYKADPSVIARKMTNFFSEGE
ncbi:flagellar biosynthesis anti-sigma factor FlgM [Salimicrobium humidisoli]|nr:flagellar biosynthesis anti-sigma factor FlgM [Salimicrobium humidisoli]